MTGWHPNGVMSDPVILPQAHLGEGRLVLLFVIGYVSGFASAFEKYHIPLIWASTQVEVQLVTFLVAAKAIQLLTLLPFLICAEDSSSRKHNVHLECTNFMLLRP